MATSDKKRVKRCTAFPVIPGLDPGINSTTVPRLIPGSSPGMTNGDHDRGSRLGDDDWATARLMRLLVNIAYVSGISLRNASNVISPAYLVPLITKLGVESIFHLS